MEHNTNRGTAGIPLCVSHEKVTHTLLPFRSAFVMRVCAFLPEGSEWACCCDREWTRVRLSRSASESQGLNAADSYWWRHPPCGDHPACVGIETKRVLVLCKITNHHLRRGGLFLIIIIAHCTQNIYSYLRAGALDALWTRKIHQIQQRHFHCGACVCNQKGKSEMVARACGCVCTCNKS